MERPGSGRFGIALNGRLAAILQVTDEAREEARRAIDLLRMLGIARLDLATGDTAAIAGEIAAKVGIDTVRAGLTASDKIDIVVAEKERLERWSWLATE